MEATVSYTRPETDEEEQAREKVEGRMKRNEEVRDKQLLAELKAKYGE